VENQDYIHYRKGSLVMYALADAIGEDNVNRALRAFRDRYAFRGPPYPNTTALLAELRKVTPPQLAYLIDDGFESIVLYDNRAVRATAARRGEDRYAVTMDLVAHKRRADAMGKESDLPLDDWIDVGVQDGTGALLYRGKQHFTAEASSVTVEVNGVPARAGIDPLNLLIDRVPRDNLVTVDVQ
jgi:aminopeptidase N